MRIALLGYGKMGKMIERIAVSRGHQVVLVVDLDNRADCSVEQLRQADVAIEFTTPAVAVDNYKWCMDAGVPVVSGTTGWLDRWEEVVGYCREKGGGFFYASNFSIGVNIFFRLNKYLAKMMDNFRDYKIFIEETHHIHKLDAPSGTAITLAEGIIKNHSAYRSWKLYQGEELGEDVLPVAAKRIGEVPGIHGVTYKSAVDEIEIRHSAFSREGFAQGAVFAAEFLFGKKGVYGMDDLLSDKLKV
ncbi:MAG TPA: 4-hydroxy-tetrahydrodipicolinate reductase [Candidatus Odoribacter faecigallinarum]|jgi:4-hydroxy-tetrahydrodipicolinate reductase|uniref:4-hydroxy-tetrahydrodipicolinate reductase n=1 Tax=Candidatus Odoribacter faecigallinarum TaxID=2838706 RepID=A0A9D1V0V9_9BACT|nr:4-hydroxy-tetrahydrodipicolinate reductase [Candidatus Odoribacter faecigallinarum]